MQRLNGRSIKILGRLYWKVQCLEGSKGFIQSSADALGVTESSLMGEQLDRITPVVHRLIWQLGSILNIQS